MYRRVPPALKAGQSCSTRPPPRYYDYTEDFEDKDPPFTPLTQTLAPLRPQILRYPRPTMLREEDDHLAAGHLAAVFGEGDSAFFDCESQVVDGQDALPGLTTILSRSQSRAETPDGSTSCRRPDSAPSQNSTIEFEASELGGRNTRSSDIDLLPSQIGRESIDTFNPSLDLESRDIPPSYKCVTYHANTAPKTQTKSPERRVQVLGGRAPTIRSEQGVILRDDTHYETADGETPDSCQPPGETGADELYSPNQPNELLVNSDLVGQEFHGARAASVRDKPERTSLSPKRVEKLAREAGLDSQRSGGLVSSLKAEAAAEPEEATEKETEKKSENDELETSHPEQFRCHRRNHAALRISTTNLPREDNEGHPHIAPTCSTVPLVSPKPISPARQLKVKNSIPQLMKALPPLPGALGYDLPSTTTDVVEEDEFAEILVPFNFHRSDEPLQLRQPQALNPMYMMSNIGVTNPQRDGPKFKLKINTASCSEASDSLAHKRQSYTDKRTPHSERLSDTETSEELGNKYTRNRNRNKLKVRSPRRSGLSSSHCSTVRRNPRVETPRIVTDIMRQKPQDLFDGPLQSETILLRKRRKPLSHLVYPQAVTIFNASDSTSLDRRVDSAGYRMLSTISTDNNEMPAIDRDTLINSIPSHGLIKRLSNIHALLSSSTTPATRAQGRGSLRIPKVTVNALANPDCGIKKSVMTAGFPATETNELRFGQRIRARLSRWVRGARTAMRRCTKTKHNRHKQERAEQT